MARRRRVPYADHGEAAEGDGGEEDGDDAQPVQQRGLLGDLARRAAERRSEDRAVPIGPQAAERDADTEPRAAERGRPGTERREGAVGADQRDQAAEEDGGAGHDLQPHPAGREVPRLVGAKPKWKYGPTRGTSAPHRPSNTSSSPLRAPRVRGTRSVADIWRSTPWTAEAPTGYPVKIRSCTLMRRHHR
jgi:hypothetical protein